MTTIRDFADIGDANAPVGSPPWCKYAHGVLRTNKRRTASNVSALKYMLIEFKKEERWKQLTDDKDKPFQSWEDYVQYPEPNGLGMAPASAKLVMEELDDSRLLGDVLVADAADRKAKEQQPHGGDRSKLDNKKGDINLAYPTGTSRAAALRRLRKDRPDIHARVLRGELTPNAGMIEAGFRKKPKSRKLSRVDRAKKLVEAMTKTEFQAFKKWVIER